MTRPSARSLGSAGRPNTGTHRAWPDGCLAADARGAVVRTGTCAGSRRRACPARLGGARSAVAGVGAEYDRSRAARRGDRAVYLRRPDLGRRLDSASRERIKAAAGGTSCELALMIGDGLSAKGVAAHAPALVEALLPHVARLGLGLGPVVLAEGARVALGDEVGVLLGARARDRADRRATGALRRRQSQRLPHLRSYSRTHGRRAQLHLEYPSRWTGPGSRRGQSCLVDRGGARHPGHRHSAEGSERLGGARHRSGRRRQLETRIDCPDVAGRRTDRLKATSATGQQTKGRSAEEHTRSLTAAHQGNADLSANGQLEGRQLLLGQTKIESTVRYFGVEIDDAIEIAEKIDV